MQKKVSLSKRTNHKEIESTPTPKDNKELIEETDKLLDKIDDLLEDVDGITFKDKLRAWASNQGNLKSCGTCACGLAKTCRLS